MYRGYSLSVCCGLSVGGNLSAMCEDGFFCRIRVDYSRWVVVIEIFDQAVACDGMRVITTV